MILLVKLSRFLISCAWNLFWKNFTCLAESSVSITSNRFAKRATTSLPYYQDLQFPNYPLINCTRSATLCQLDGLSKTCTTRSIPVDVFFFRQTARAISTRHMGWIVSRNLFAEKARGWFNWECVRFGLVLGAENAAAFFIFWWMHRHEPSKE